MNTIPFGIGVAASTCVGNQLGLQSAIGAKQTAHLSALLSIVVGAIVMVIMLATKDVSSIAFIMRILIHDDCPLGVWLHVQRRS